MGQNKHDALERIRITMRLFRVYRALDQNISERKLDALRRGVVWVRFLFPGIIALALSEREGGHV